MSSEKSLGALQQPLPYPGALQAVGLVVLVSLVMGAVKLPFRLLESLLQTEINAFAVSLLSGLAFVLLYCRNKPQVDLRLQLALRPFRPALFVLFVVVVIALRPMIADGTVLSTRLFPVPEWIGELFKGSTKGLLGVLAVVLVGPIAEEVLFRGVILAGFLRRYSTSKAIAGCAVLFAAYHLNPWQLLPAFFVGLLLSWHFARTGLVAHCIAGHMVLNALAYVERGLPTESGFVYPWWSHLLALTLFIFGIVLLARYVDPRQQHDKHTEVRFGESD